MPNLTATMRENPKARAWVISAQGDETDEDVIKRLHKHVADTVLSELERGHVVTSIDYSIHTEPRCTWRQAIIRFEHLHWSGS